QENPPVNGLFITGHSHILKVMPDRELHFLHINPGACGSQGWHKVKTLVRFTLDKGVISGLEVIELKSS
ncbi:MAG: YfcE family phosphodiesterase, partial [Bacteroidota bacterium]